jgi:hypothetical protein
VSHRAIFDAAAILLTPAGLLLAAALTGVALKLFASDEPRNGTGQDLQDLAGEEPEPASADLELVA